MNLDLPGSLVVYGKCNVHCVYCPETVLHPVALPVEIHDLMRVHVFYAGEKCIQAKHPQPSLHSFMIYAQIDLGIPGMPNYRDKGYSGSETRGINAGVDKASRNHSLSIDQVRRNRRISGKRSPGERPYSVIKRIFRGGHVFVTMIRRVRVKATFMCLGYNLLTLLTLKKQGKIAQAI